MTNPTFDKRKILASLLQLPNTMVDSLNKLQTDLLDTISQARSLPSPSSFVSATCSTDDSSRCELAPPSHSVQPRFAATCYQEYNCAMSGLNMNLEAMGAEGINQRCFLKKLRKNDTRVRGILAGSKPPRDCRCQHSQHSPDSAYDSSSNCSWDLEEDTVFNVEQIIEEDSSESKDNDDDTFDWGDEEEEDSYVPSDVDMRALSELEPSILFVPHAGLVVEEDKRQMKLREVNSRWNQFYSPSNASCIYNNQTCKLCYTKKSVRMRDSKPRVFTFITAF